MRKFTISDVFLTSASLICELLTVEGGIVMVHWW